MKKLLTIMFGALLCAFAFPSQAATCDLIMDQLDSFGNKVPKLVATPSGCTGASGFVVYDINAVQPKIWAPDSTITIGATTIGVSTATLNSKFNVPSGTTSQYVRGDGSLATLPSASPFDFGFPSARTLAVSTSYQAANNAKAAIITVSPTCTNSTTVLASSACTLQIRVDASTATCSTGTVVATWTSTYALGLLLTNTSGSPVDIKLPAGGFFILCPTAGTFTLANAVDQSAG